MAVVTENIIRKIVKNSILKKENFYRNKFDITRGVDFDKSLKCDLSNLKNSAKFNAWFAKHFLFNPIVKVNNGNMEGVNRGNIASSVLGFHMSAEEEEEYTKQVEEYVRNNPGILDTWYRAFEFFLEISIFPVGYVFCQMINSFFAGGGKAPSAATIKGASDQEVNNAFQRAMTSAGIEIQRANSISTHEILKDPQFLVIYPKTLTNLIAGTTDGLDAIFDIEKERLENIITSGGTPRSIYRNINNNMTRIRGKNAAMSHISHIVNQENVSNNERYGRIMIRHLKILKDEVTQEISNAISP